MIPAPQVFHQYQQFITHNADKKPFDPFTGEVIDPLDPVNHLTYDEASARAGLYGLGIGFVFTENDPFFFLDIDKCLLPTGEWSILASTLCSQFAGCYVEVSLSGKGLHIFGQYTALPEHGCKNTFQGIELYHTERYAALTGTNASGDSGLVCDLALEVLVGEHFPPSEVDISEWTTEARVESNPIADDTELVKRMLESKSSTSAMFGTGATVQQLWKRDVDALSVSFPHETNDFDLSSADAALCSHLAFWTGENCERIERLFNLSALVRVKWQKREDYRRRTIKNACANCSGIYGKSVEVPEHSEGLLVPDTVVDKEGYQFMDTENQKKHFSGCTYVLESDRVLLPDGMMIGQSQFKNQFGGYDFQLVTGQEKKTVDPWKIFTSSQSIGFPKVRHTRFDPSQPAQHISHDDIGRSYVNTYIPPTIASTPGDATPFTEHIRKMVPDDNDRASLMAYLAACVQHQGVKFQWCPLIQGVQGNGKSLISECVTRAIGQRYVHPVNATDISNKFNSYLENNVLIVVEEINVKGKYDLMDILKPMITQRNVEIQAKGQDQRPGKICCNFIMFTNHKTALIKTESDRRHAIFYTNQQEMMDMIRDGMTGSYFPDLWNWLRDGGYEIVNHYLQNYQIPDVLNPAIGCQRAPTTSSTIEAIAMSLDSAAQIIQEAIGEGRPGFRGGWISTIMLNRLFERCKIKKSLIHRREMLKDLGYVKHPALKDGRVNNRIQPDNGKPRLYVHRDNAILMGINESALASRIYVNAQYIDTVGIFKPQNEAAE